MTARADVRQCGLSLPSDWHDDPPQEGRALVQDQLCNAVPILVFLFHLDAACSQFHVRPCDEHVIPLYIALPLVLLPHLVVELLYLHLRPRIELVTIPPSDLCTPARTFGVLSASTARSTGCFLIRTCVFEVTSARRFHS